MSVLFTEAFDVWYDNSSSFISFTVDGFGFLLAFCLVCLVERIVLGSGCLVGLCEGDLSPLQGIKV